MVEGEGPSLLGCNWLQVVWLDWQALGITHVSTKPASLESLLQKHSQLFGTDLGTMKDLMATSQCNWTRRHAIPILGRYRML